MTARSLRVAAGSLFAIVAAVGGAASVSAEPGPVARPAIANDGECVSTPQAGAGSSRFAVDFLAAASEDGTRTAIVSPLSVEAVLAMAGRGASDSFRRAVRRLFVEDTGDWKPACRQAAVLNAAGTDEAVALHIANGAFAAHSLDIFRAFRAALKNRFGAKVARLDFSQARAVETINAWVTAQTNRTIPRLLADLPRDTSLVLVNALHFKGKWAHPFDPARTTVLPFRLGSGETVGRATMLIGPFSADYREDESFQALELAYGDGDFTLTVVVPRPGIAPADAIAGLRADPSWLAGAGFDRAVGTLLLPRLNLAHTGDVLPLLEGLGLSEALREPDTFSGIGAPAPKLSQVIHATRLSLDEEGAEAGAATAAVFAKSAAEPHFLLQVNRPFALAVRRRDGGDLLFAAWVDDPGHSMMER